MVDISVLFFYFPIIYKRDLHYEAYLIILNALKLPFLFP